MKKLFLNLFVLAVGLGVFIAAVVNISTPIVLLKPTSDPAIHAEYIAPSVHFMGVIPPLNGKAHIASTAKSKTVRKKQVAQSSARTYAGEVNTGVLFGQFSTAKAMGYHAGPVEYHRRMLTCPLVREYVK